MSLESLFPRRQANTDELYVSIRHDLNHALLTYGKKNKEYFRKDILSAMDGAAQLYYGLNGSADKEWMKSFHLNGDKPYTARLSGDISDALEILGYIRYNADNPGLYCKKIEIFMDHCARILNFK